MRRCVHIGVEEINGNYAPCAIFVIMQFSSVSLELSCSPDETQRVLRDFYILSRVTRVEETRNLK